MPSVDYSEQDVVGDNEAHDLYASVGWSAYLDRSGAIRTAIDGSSYVATARVDGRLVGLARVVSDDSSIAFLQDLLINPDFQGQGIGRRLVDMVLARYSHVPRIVLLTDDEARQHHLYRSVGFTDIGDVDRLHGFVRFQPPDG